MEQKGPIAQRRQLTILLVEDSASAAELIRDSILKLPGVLTVTVVSSLAAASAWLDGNTPHLAVVDLNLPDGKGTRLLPPDKDAAQFPIVIMTDSGSETEAVEAIKSGAIDYLVKSSETIRELPKAIERVLRQWEYVIRQRLAEDALRDSEERFRSIFFTAAAGMVVISPAKVIIQVNPAFCQFTGYSEEELLGRDILDLAFHDDHDRVEALYEELFSGKTTAIDCERRFIRNDGSTVWGHVSLSCVLASERYSAHCIAMVQDVTLRKLLEERLLTANRELDAFVHSVSHDLRSPLTPINGYLQVILDQYAAELPSAVNTMLQEALRQGDRMRMMLEDLLALATIGSVEPPLTPVCGSELFREVMLGISSGRQDIMTKVTAGPLPDLLLPKTLYRQILDNLIGNAIRYAGDRPVEVACDRRGNLVRISVRDHGPGVPDDEKERIFELFFRGEAGRQVAGTGIGLATIRKIAKLYNGTAWVEDAPGGGSIFIVELQDGFQPPVQDASLSGCHPGGGPDGR